MKSRRGFTLLEIIISMTIFFVLFVIIVSLYTKMVRLKYSIQARQSLIESSYNAMEKINLLLQDYTIDYEEYFDRQRLGCNGDAGANFTRNVGTGGYCADFTSYGNGSGTTPNIHDLYYCNSRTYPDILNGAGCPQTGRQSFEEYALQFRDSFNEITGTNIMKGPDAIGDATGMQELYLISQDGKHRIYLRRILVESGDRNHDNIISGDSEYLYTLQILKLRGLDAGDHHDFDIATSSGVYDGHIDTRVCDYAQGFVCNGSGVGPLYTGYAMPANTNDGWANLFDQNLTVSDRNLVIYPTKNPDYALAQDEVQINPYFTISLTNKLYGKIRQKKLGLPSLDDFQLSLQTTFSTKSFYTK